MKFVLVRTSEGWTIGPEVFLPAVPEAGSLVWVDEDRHELSIGEGCPGMYVVDNIMYVECREGADETVFLFVHLYEGFGERVPLAPAESAAVALNSLTEAVRETARRLDDIYGVLDCVDDRASEAAAAAESLEKAVDKLAWDVTDKLDRIADLADDIKFRLRDD